VSNFVSSGHNTVVKVIKTTTTTTTTTTKTWKLTNQQRAKMRAFEKKKNVSDVLHGEI
jgi:hypothetical protein